MCWSQPLERPQHVCHVLSSRSVLFCLRSAGANCRAEIDQPLSAPSQLARQCIIDPFSYPLLALACCRCQSRTKSRCQRTRRSSIASRRQQRRVWTNSQTRCSLSPPQLSTPPAACLTGRPETQLMHERATGRGEGARCRQGAAGHVGHRRRAAGRQSSPAPQARSSCLRNSMPA